MGSIPRRGDRVTIICGKYALRPAPG